MLILVGRTMSLRAGHTRICCRKMAQSAGSPSCRGLDLAIFSATSVCVQTLVGWHECWMWTDNMCRMLIVGLRDSRELILGQKAGYSILLS